MYNGQEKPHSTHARTILCAAGCVTPSDTEDVENHTDYRNKIEPIATTK